MYKICLYYYYGIVIFVTPLPVIQSFLYSVHVCGISTGIEYYAFLMHGACMQSIQVHQDSYMTYEQYLWHIL